jgi:hypothetical protein
MQPDRGRDSTWANRFVPSNGWGTKAELIESNDDVPVIFPQVAVDPIGNAIAMWMQGFNILANRFMPTTGWGTATRTNYNNNFAQSPQVAVDAAGNAIAVWVEGEGEGSNIWANRFEAVGTRWGATTVKLTEKPADSPQVAVDSQGFAIAVWKQSDGTQSSIWANRFEVGAGWGTTTEIETDHTGPVQPPQIAVNSIGSAIAVWVRDSSIWANRFVQGRGWETAVAIQTDNSGSAAAPQAAINSFGNAIAIWQQSDGTRNNVWANLFEVP